MDLDGFLLVDKPKGWTSFDVVAKIRGVIKRETGQKVKVGHTGTLDPLATGLMIIVIGSYCKRAVEFSKLDKTYEVTMKLGETSTTGDEEGQKTTVSNHQPPEEEIKNTLNSFLGESLQTPPAYSAVKVGGKRAYKLARQGQEVTIESRKVRINSIEMIDYSYPLVEFTVDVSSGTYIRSLVIDMGEKLKTGAYISNLRRTQVDTFKIQDSLSNLDNLDYRSVAGNLLEKPTDI
jgi:tRNA pseudouridine55 synthase